MSNTQHFYIITTSNKPGQCKIGYHTGSRTKLYERCQTLLIRINILLFVPCNGKLVKMKVRNHLNLIHANFAKNRKSNDSDWVTIDEAELIGISESIIDECKQDEERERKRVNDLMNSLPNNLNSGLDLKHNPAPDGSSIASIIDNIVDDSDDDLNNSNNLDDPDDSSNDIIDDSEVIDLTSNDTDANQFSDVKIKVEETSDTEVDTEVDRKINVDDTEVDTKVDRKINVDDTEVDRKINIDDTDDTIDIKTRRFRVFNDTKVDTNTIVSDVKRRPKRKRNTLDSSFDDTEVDTIDTIDTKTRPKKKLSIFDSITSFWDTFVVPDNKSSVKAKELYSLYIESVAYTNSDDLTQNEFDGLVLNRSEVTKILKNGKHYYIGIRINLGFNKRRY